MIPRDPKPRWRWLRCTVLEMLARSLATAVRTHLLSSTGTSTACSVFGLSLEPGFSAPQPAAQPNLPRKSSFFSGRQMGAAQRDDAVGFLRWGVVGFCCCRFFFVGSFAERRGKTVVPERNHNTPRFTPRRGRFLRNIHNSMGGLCNGQYE